MHVEDAVDKVLDTYWDGNIPVEPKSIARAMGIKLLVLEENEEGACSRLHIEEQQPIISIKTKEPHTRQRFCIAHTLGHLSLGHLFMDHYDTPKTFGINNFVKEERDANHFATLLLVPAFSLKEAVEKHRFGFAELCHTFGVADAVMLLRLKALGYI